MADDKKLDVRDFGASFKGFTRTKGVSAGFIRELLRRAALFAADEGARVVGDKHVDVALQELVVEGGKLTHTLLGATAIRGFRPS